MSRPAADRQFYLVRFDASTEAAAFIVDLSQYLDSPAGREFAGEPGALEVWHDTLAPIEIYLAPGALAAAEATFTRVPLTKVVQGSDLPKSVALLGEHHTPPWGMAEIRERLRDPRGQFE